MDLSTMKWGFHSTSRAKHRVFYHEKMGRTQENKKETGRNENP